MENAQPRKIKIDIRGQVCPSSLLSTLREINLHHNSLHSGSDIINVLTDNRDALTTIPQAAMNMGYFVKVLKKEGYYSIAISKEELPEQF